MLNDEKKIGASVMLNTNALKGNRLAWKVQDVKAVERKCRDAVIRTIVKGSNSYYHNSIDKVEGYVKHSVKNGGLLYDIVLRYRARHKELCNSILDTAIEKTKVDWDLGIDDYILNKGWEDHVSYKIDYPPMGRLLQHLVKIAVKRKYDPEVREEGRGEFNLETYEGFFAELTLEDTDAIAENYVSFSVENTNTGPKMRPSGDTADRCRWSSIDEDKHFYIGKKLNKQNIGVILSEYQYGDREDWYEDKEQYGMYYKVAFVSSDGPVVGWFNNQYLKNASKANINRLKRELDALKKEQELESA